MLEILYPKENNNISITKRNTTNLIDKERIRKRLKQRLSNGMIEEVQTLLDEGITHNKLRFFGLEYKFISMYLTGELNRNDMHQKLASAIIQFSKKQMTWFRKMEKEGIKIHWLKNNEMNKAENLIKNFINEKNNFPNYSLF